MTQAIFIGGSYALRMHVAQTRSDDIGTDHPDDTDDRWRRSMSADIRVGRSSQKSPGYLLGFVDVSNYL
jgi:hypothetical protein